MAQCSPLSLTSDALPIISVKWSSVVVKFHEICDRFILPDNATSKSPPKVGAVASKDLLLLEILTLLHQSFKTYSVSKRQGEEFDQYFALRDAVIHAVLDEMHNLKRAADGLNHALVVVVDVPKWNSLIEFERSTVKAMKSSAHKDTVRNVCNRFERICCTLGSAVIEVVRRIWFDYFGCAKESCKREAAFYDQSTGTSPARVSPTLLSTLSDAASMTDSSLGTDNELFNGSLEDDYSALTSEYDDDGFDDEDDTDFDEPSGYDADHDDELLDAMPSLLGRSGGNDFDVKVESAGLTVFGGGKIDNFNVVGGEEDSSKRLSVAATNANDDLIVDFTNQLTSLRSAIVEPAVDQSQIKDDLISLRGSHSSVSDNMIRGFLGRVEESEVRISTFFEIFRDFGNEFASVQPGGGPDLIQQPAFQEKVQRWKRVLNDSHRHSFSDTGRLLECDGEIRATLDQECQQGQRRKMVRVSDSSVHQSSLASESQLSTSFQR